VCIARIAILNIVINLSISRRHYNSCILSNTKKIGSVVDLGALAICESVFFWPPRGRMGGAPKILRATLKLRANYN
jgi:hypothetical protein